MREDQILERIARAARRMPGAAGLPVGVGDDAAILRAAPRSEWVISTDNFNEGSHFLAAVHPPEVAGYKSLARALSDLAAMGARPRCFLLGLTLPRARAGAWLDGFLRGVRRAARRFGVALAGGDTSRAAGCAGVSINVTVMGEVPAGRGVLRSRARPGDALYVSGTLGRAQLGLELLLADAKRARSQWSPLLRPHFYPEPRLALGAWLAARGLASAMMDISDGLSTDLARLCAASGVRARLDLGIADWPGVRIPAELAARFPKLRNARGLALHGGEDYELLITVPRRLAHRIPRSFRGLRLTRIGEILPGRGIEIEGGRGHTRPLPARGWDPFL
jgi:thiamine-monophosphate kinase